MTIDQLGITSGAGAWLRSAPARRLALLAVFALTAILMPASVVIANPGLDNDKCSAASADPDLISAGFTCYNLYNRGPLVKRGAKQIVGQMYLKHDAATDDLTIKLFTADNGFEGGKLCLDDDPSPINTLGTSCEGNPAGAIPVSQTSVIDCTDQEEAANQFEFYVDPLTATSVAATSTVAAHRQVVLTNVDESCDEVLIHFNSGNLSILGYGQPTPQPPDVTVSKTPNAGTVNAGSNAVFTVVVTNSGPGAAENVMLTDTLPNSGLSWTVGGADAASCTIAAGPPQSLSCNFGTIPASGTRTITLTSATDAADCGRSSGTGRIDNTALVSSTSEGAAQTANNSDSGQITVICGAIKINKNSTKGGAVANAGAVFSVAGAGITGTMSVTDNGTGDANTTTGVLCVTGLQPGQTYTVNETSAPTGYGAATQANLTAVAEAAACASLTSAASTTFTNAPLGEFVIDFNDLGSGETSAKIDCTGLTPTPADSTSTLHDDNIETYTNLPGGDPAIVYTCTISIDP